MKLRELKLIVESVMNEPEYIGVCNDIRKTKDGREFWQYAMDNYNEIDRDDFLDVVNIDVLLDEDEDAETYLYESEQQDPDMFYGKVDYKDDEFYLFGTGGKNGFEYFWKLP